MNLNNATNEQLDAYKDKVAGILNIDPMMLDYIWIYDSESGLRNQVLYAKRGAAEVMREQRKISITSLVSQEGNGWIMFTATGTIPSGRQEIAVGAAYVEGHKADKKAHAVMTAQTRAVRRLTLQFVGGGILDETEVQTQNELMAQPAASQATLAGSPIVVPTIPTVAPPSAPGRDITPATVDSFEGTRPAPLGEQFVGQPAQINEAMAAVQAKMAAAEAVTGVNETIVAPKKVRAPRKPKTVSLSSPGQPETVAPATSNPIQLTIPVGQIDASGTITPVSTPVPAATVPYPPQLEEKAQPVAPVQPQVALPKPEITADKHKEFKEKTRLYTNDVLVKGNMLPSDGIGGISMKFRKFAITYSKVADTTQLTTLQWEQLFAFLDAYLASSSPAALVLYINQQIGAA